MLDVWTAQGAWHSRGSCLLAGVGHLRHFPQVCGGNGGGEEMGYLQKERGTGRQRTCG